jgi:hypothetical protein
MWGNRDLGVLLIYTKYGGGYKEAYRSKGDLTRLREWVRTVHGDPLPVGLYISFRNAWNAVKGFMATEESSRKASNGLPTEIFLPIRFPIRELCRPSADVVAAKRV